MLNSVNKYDLSRVSSITVIMSEKVRVYERDISQRWWHKDDIKLRLSDDRMQDIIVGFETAGYVVIPVAGAYIPTDTHVVRIGKWKSNLAEQWGFRPVEQYHRNGGKWKEKHGGYISDLQLLRFINEAVENNEIIRFYNENMGVIGHYE